MTQVCNVKSEIEKPKINMDEAITMQVLSSLKFFFAKFIGILSHKVREKEKLCIPENLAKY